MKKDREKSSDCNEGLLLGIERRLYDIISVLCGLGIIKRKVDSLEWNLTSLDRDAENTRTIATYNKGKNMMICLANYLLVDNPSESGIPGILQKDDPSIDEVWSYLRNVFNERHIITVVDIEYLMRIIKEARVHPIDHF